PHVRTARELAGGHLRPRRPGGARGRAGGHGGGAMSEVTRIPVGTDYDVLVGQGTTAHVAELLPTGVARVLLVHGEPLAGLAAPVLEALRGAGVEVHVAAVPDAEAAKTVEVAADLWGRMGRAGFTRSDAVVTVGGGSVTDLGGWAAAAWLRGVAVVHVPTTVLG